MDDARRAEIEREVTMTAAVIMRDLLGEGYIYSYYVDAASEYIMWIVDLKIQLEEASNE